MEMIITENKNYLFLEFICKVEPKKKIEPIYNYKIKIIDQNKCNKKKKNK